MNIRYWLLCILFSLAACSDKSNPEPTDSCGPGITRLCNCTPTQEGAQYCLDDAKSWSTCECTGGPVNDADAGEAGSSADTGSHTPKPRNILLVIADDLGVDASMCYGRDSNVAKTPNIKSLCDRGVVFTNAWSNPICSPTRATMLTGRYSFRTGVGAQVTGTQPGIMLSEVTIPKMLKQANAPHRAANIGKWHLSDNDNGNEDNPGLMGYDHFSGLLIGGVRDYSRWNKTVNGETSLSENYVTTEFVDDAISWIQSSEEPWFLWLAFTAPHTPFHLPPVDLHSQTGLSGEQADIDANPLPYFHALIESMDSELGRLLNSMSPEQLANTEIIYIGDNGTTTEVNQTSTQARRGKTTLYQGGVHVPLIIAGPSVVEGGRNVDALVNGVDIFKTILDFAEVDHGALLPRDRIIDSQSLRPYLENPQATKQRDWIYSEIFGPPIRANQVGHTIRNEKYKLIRFDQSGERFYRIDTDPSEETNLLDATLDAEAQKNYDSLAQTADTLRISTP